MLRAPPQLLRGMAGGLSAARLVLQLLDRTEALATVALLAVVIRALLLLGRASGPAAVLRALLQLVRALVLVELLLALRAAVRRAPLTLGRMESGLAEVLLVLLLLDLPAARATVLRAILAAGLGPICLLVRAAVRAAAALRVLLAPRALPLERAMGLAAVSQDLLEVGRRAILLLGGAAVPAAVVGAPLHLGRALALAAVRRTLLVEVRRALLRQGQASALVTVLRATRWRGCAPAPATMMQDLRLLDQPLVLPTVTRALLAEVLRALQLRLDQAWSSAALLRAPLMLTSR